MYRICALFAVLAVAPSYAGSSERQPAYLLEVPPSIGILLIAETGTSTLHRYSNDVEGIRPDGSNYISIGSNGVGKVRAWDRKTPLGIYFITEQLDTSDLHQKYGPVAFPLDYPNIWDRISHRSGDGIWIHGVTPDGGRRPPLDTDGCIALPNPDLLALQPRLAPHRTPVIVTRQLSWESPENISAERDALREALGLWTESFETGDLHMHLSLYADEFSYRGMDRKEWSAFRTHSLSEAPARQVVLEDILLLADPEEPGLFLSRFRQAVIYGNREVVTTKRLYWRRMADGALKIVAEDNG